MRTSKSKKKQTNEWPKCKHDRKSPDTITKNIGDLVINFASFEDQLKLLRHHDKSAGYVPKVLFKKGGGNPGLADYFLAGLPDRNFGLRDCTQLTKINALDERNLLS